MTAIPLKKFALWLNRTFKKLSTLEKHHFHRNFGMLYLSISLYIHIKFLGFVWYANENIITSISPLIFYLYSILALVLPLSAFVQFLHIISNKKLRTNHGNSFDTIYSDFFVQWQAVFICLRTYTLGNVFYAINNPYFDFIVGIFIPQTLYRYFRPSKKAGVRDVTSAEYNAKEIEDMWAANDKETIAEIKKLQSASQKFQTNGYCALKWLIIGFNFVVIYYGESRSIPDGMLNFMHEMCLLSSCYEPIYPFMYTLKHKGILYNEKIYWKVWSNCDFFIQVMTGFMIVSFLFNHFVYGDIWRFPVVLYLAFAGFCVCGFVINQASKYKHTQDYFLVGMFGLMMMVKTYL